MSIRQIGSGTYGNVTACADGAVKSQELDYASIREYCFLKNLNHPNIISVANLDHEKRDCVSFCMPEGMHDLSKCVNYSTERIVKIMYGMLQGLEYMHAHAIMHRDIKSNNVIIFPDDTVKIIDLGISTFQKKEHISGCGHSGKVQTTCYKAPEVAQHLSYDYSIDMWSCGVILLYLLQKDKNYTCMLETFGNNIEDASQFVHSFFSRVLGAPKESKMFSQDTEYFKKCWLSKKAPRIYNLVRVEKDHPLLNLAFQLLAWDPQDRISAKQALAHPVFDIISEFKHFTGSRVETKQEFVWKSTIMSTQEELSLKMYRILYDWMKDVRKLYKLPVQALVAAYCVVNNMLEKKAVQRINLQNLGITAIYLTSNLYCYEGLGASEAKYVCDDAYTSFEIQEMCVSIMNTLDVHDLAQEFFVYKASDEQWENLVNNIINIEQPESFPTSKFLFAT